MFIIFLSYLLKWFRARTMDFIPLATEEYKLTFCQATNALPTDVQRAIWAMTIADASPPSTPPPAPIKKKKITPSPRLGRLMNNWARRRL